MTRQEYIYLRNSELISAALLILEQVNAPDIVDNNTLLLLKDVLRRWGDAFDLNLHIDVSEVDDVMIREIRTEEIKPDRNPEYIDKMLFLLPNCDLEIVRNDDGTPMVTSSGNWVLSGTTDSAFFTAKQQGYVEFA